MKKRLFSAAIVSGVATTALLIPLSAGAASAHPHAPDFNKPVKVSKKFDAETRQEIRAAKREFREAMRDAWRTYKTDTADQRAEFRAAREAAETPEERKAARQAFREATAEQRATFKAAKQAAIDARKAAIAVAKA